MKAIVYQKSAQPSLLDVTKPIIHEPTDAIVKIQKTTICGTDLHILQGDLPEVKNGLILGHEGIGIIEQVGDNVKNFKSGDRVIISCITSCGACRYCKRTMLAHCVNGGWILGHLINGTQAEYVRIPYADNSLYLLPHSINDEAALMLSDILPTGFEIGVLNGQVKPGDNVAFVGAGPVGMAAMLTAQFFTPAQIIMIDTNEQRLAMARQFGANRIINPQRQNVITEINSLTNGDGVDVAVECVGINTTFKICQDIIAKGGHIANIGVHGHPVNLQLETLWIKNITITTGLVNSTSTTMLLNTLNNIKISPAKLVSHHFAFKQFEQAYKVFANAVQEKAMKVVISAD